MFNTTQSILKEVKFSSNFLRLKYSQKYKLLMNQADLHIGVHADGAADHAWDGPAEREAGVRCMLLALCGPVGWRLVPGPAVGLQVSEEGRAPSRMALLFVAAQHITLSPSPTFRRLACYRDSAEHHHMIQQLPHTQPCKLNHRSVTTVWCHATTHIARHNAESTADTAHTVTAIM